MLGIVQKISFCVLSIFRKIQAQYGNRKKIEVVITIHWLAGLNYQDRCQWVGTFHRYARRRLIRHIFGILILKHGLHDQVISFIFFFFYFSNLFYCIYYTNWSHNSMSALHYWNVKERKKSLSIFMKVPQNGRALLRLTATLVPYRTNTKSRILMSMYLVCMHSWTFIQLSCVERIILLLLYTPNYPKGKKNGIKKKYTHSSKNEDKTWIH